MYIFQSRFIVIQTIYLLNIIISIWYILNFEFTLYSFLIVSIIFLLMNPLGIAIVYHRFWSHKSFKFKNDLLKYFCTIPPMISCVGSVLGWVGMHRSHHVHSDKDNDPHMASKGYLNMFFMTSYDYKPNPRHVIDLLRNKFILITHNYYFTIPLIYAVFCYLMFGIHGLVLGFCMPAGISLITQNTTNYVNHKGSVQFEPTNVIWINILNAGDGWHKNHHENPRSYTTQKEWWQLDIAGLIIKHLLAKSVINYNHYEQKKIRVPSY